MKKVKFYHSVICPRCHVSQVMLSRALRLHPEVELTRVELFANRAEARRDGVTSVPALVAEGGRKLSGAVLTPGAIRRFLDSLDVAT